MLMIPPLVWDIAWIFLILNVVILLVVAPILVGYILFRILLKRTALDKWDRSCPTDEPNQQIMFEQGMQWHRENRDAGRPVRIENDGLTLVGEFYDFGSSRTAVILPGRTDCLTSSYFFAQPYAENGCNVFVFDPRAHGESDGVYNAVGFEEQKDLIAWLRYLQTDCHTEQVVLHGICVGTSSGLFALENQQCPNIVAGLVTEGVFSTFYESVKNHMIERKKPHHLILPWINIWFRAHTGHSMRYGPEHVLPRMKLPLLMLHCRQDPYSLPHTAQAMFDSAGPVNKQLVWFPEGEHSRLRLADREKYDTAIAEFLKTIW